MIRRVIVKKNKRSIARSKAFDKKRLKQGADEFVKRYGSVIKQLAKE